MNNLNKVILLLSCVVIFSYASDILAVVNGHNITRQVAPNNFNQMTKQMQNKIVKRLIDKRIACDYALKQDIVDTQEFKKILKHVLIMDKSKKNLNTKLGLISFLENQETIKGYTKEQLYSKKGLLAFDFLVSKYAENLKISLKEQQEYYNKNRYKYDTPAIKELLSIIVEDKKTALMVIKKLLSAKDILQKFSTLAKKYSLAPSASKNGYFGKIATYELNNRLRPILKDLKRSEFTKQPIKTEFGYQIFYILNDIPKFNSKFNLVKTKIKNEIMQKKVKQWAIETIVKSKKSAKIEVKYF
jgi:foldase protein PrsA